MKSKCGKFVRLDKNAVEVVTKLANENVELKAENAKLKKRVQTLAQANRELTNENDAYFTLAEKQEAKIAELKALIDYIDDNWIDVNVSLPAELPHRGVMLLVAKENRVVMEAMFNTKTKEFQYNWKPLSLPVTHWQPLPEPPTQEKDDV